MVTYEHFNCITNFSLAFFWFRKGVGDHEGSPLPPTVYGRGDPSWSPAVLDHILWGSRPLCIFYWLLDSIFFYWLQ